MYYDLGWYTSFIILIPALLFATYAQMKITSNYNKYSQVMSRKGFTGADAARKMLDANGLNHVSIRIIGGRLSDNYNPGTQTVSLSKDVYYGNSVAAIGIACHECGHAVQHATGYGALKIRNLIIPVANFGSGLAIPIFFIGLVLGMQSLTFLGILFFSFAVLFQAVTLPVEFNASSRALNQMKELGIVTKEEETGAKKVLGAAAMTYVAALLVSLMHLLRLILLSRSRR